MPALQTVTLGKARISGGGRIARPTEIPTFAGVTGWAIGLLLALLALVASPAQAFNFPAFTGLVVDQANILPADRKAALEQKLEAFQQKTPITVSADQSTCSLHIFVGPWSTFSDCDRAQDLLTKAGQKHVPAAAPASTPASGLSPAPEPSPQASAAAPAPPPAI